MLSKKSFQIVSFILFITPLLLLGYKGLNNQSSIEDLIPRDVYEVALELDAANIPNGSFIKSYLPKNDYRQRVLKESWSGDSLIIKKEELTSGQRVVWNLEEGKNLVYKYMYEVEVKGVEYKIPEASAFEIILDDSLDSYLLSEPFIQSSHPLIDSLAHALKQKSLLNSLKANFDYVGQMENSYTRILTDAVSALEQQRASCNGKSRLFTALCRAQGIPARVVGGTILENTRKRTSHLWSEIYYRGNWIPFDVLNNHFASLPSNYLELYKGDNFLFTHNKNLDFDYQFVINKKYQTLNEEVLSSLNLWLLLNNLHISMNLLRAFLLLPLAALIIAIFRNVIGVKTFGILLPALIGLALSNVDAWTGIIAFGIVIAVVAVLHKLLERWSLLHVPKVAIILTCVIITLLVMSSIGALFEWKMGENMILLPIVIISITAERFAKVLNEEDLSEASKMLMNTFVVAFATFFIFRSNMLIGVFLTYPELYLMILLALIFLGRWIGMRVMEYRRFSPIYES